MKKDFRLKLLNATIVLTIFILPLTFSMFNLTQNSSINDNYSTITNENDNNSPMGHEYVPPISSDVFYPGIKYDLSIWWNKSYRYRIGFVLEETDGIDRHQPVDMYFTFREDEHYENTERLVSFNATGNDEWGNPIPMQMWNVTKYPTTNYVESCTITFIADISAGSNNTYFLYYNENDNGIEQINYNTNLSSSLLSGTLTVTVGTKYQAVLKTGLAATQLVRQGLDFHLDDSLAPEKQLADPSLKFLAHFENSYSDSTGNEPDGTPNGDPTFTDGKVRLGLDLDGDDFVSYANGLQALGDPFNGLSTEFTVCAWINPSSISGGATNHQTENVFIAKASDSINDNFEIGVNNEGNIHVYLDTESRDTTADFGPAGTITTAGGWYFIAFRYDNGVAEVKINNQWYSSSAWSGATDIDEANGSPFTIGASEHIEQYFKGVIDEVALYNKSLSDQEVEDFKLGSMPSTIQSITELENGEVFSQYQVDWTTAFEMHTQDICTFYYDYNLWSIRRSIYFDNEFNSTIDSMFALNTNYDFSVVDEHDELLYVYDGNLQEDITTAGFVSENYTVIHNAPDSSKDAIGIFIEDYELSDPVHTSISYFKGDVLYDNGVVQFLPGSINDFDNSVGNASYKLIIDFWELAGSVNSSGTLDNNGMINYFDDMLLSLRQETDTYIYDQDSFFYNLDVNVTDIDNNLVPEATVTVWNATDHSTISSQTTDTSGRTVFNRLEGGNYDVNVSYIRYGKTLTITSPQLIELNESTVDTYGIYYLEFTNVQMTSLTLILNRFNDTAQNNYKGRLNGAKVTFWRDDGSGPEYLGSENADENGELIFRWLAFATPQDGNITFSVEWFEIPSTNVVAIGDLDPLNVVNTTFYFHVANTSIVNCTFGSSFETNMELIVFPDPIYNQMLGDTLNFEVNLTYIENESIYYAMDGATVTYNIFSGVLKINTQPLPFAVLGGGLYSLSIDTSDLVEPGGAEWLSENDYLIEITASKAGFITKQLSTSFILDPRSSTLVGSETELTAYWGETLGMEVVYTDISFGANNFIEDANVEYAVIGVPVLTGLLTPYGSGGRYIFSLDTTQFPNSDSYIVQITASKQNYQEKTVYLDVNILAIKTLINDSVGVYETMNIPFREEQIFYFTYIEESSSLGLANSDIRTFEWTKDISNVVVDSGAGVLEELGNGEYYLDFDTETLQIATYTIIFTLEKENYAPRSGILILNVVPRTFNIILDSMFSDNIISTVSGQDLEFEIELVDKINGSHIVGADVQITVQGQIIYGNETGSGVYSFTLSGADLPDAFFLPQTISANISIDKNYYDSEELKISIVVGMVEIFPGFPMFYFLMIVIGIAAVAGSLIIYRQVQRARIPKFVKKVREMSKNIKGRKSVSDSLLYPTKEEYIVKKLGDKWDMLGLSLDEIYGLDKKKRKKLPETPESEGGAM